MRDGCRVAKCSVSDVIDMHTLGSLYEIFLSSRTGVPAGGPKYNSHHVLSKPVSYL